MLIDKHIDKSAAEANLRNQNNHIAVVTDLKLVESALPADLGADRPIPERVNLLSRQFVNLTVELSRATRVAEAAEEWWRMRRPVSYSEAEHLINPTVNCVNSCETALAATVANYVRTRNDG